MYETQNTSKERVKVNTITQDDIDNLYAFFSDKTISVDEFKVYCKSLIEKSAGSSGKKYYFLNLLDGLKRKEFLLEKTQNYILAGEGLGV
jgi:hypothetical protein